MKDVYILAVESSCDETSVSIIKNGYEVNDGIYNKESLRLTNMPNMTKLKEYSKGLFYVQDESSMIAANVLNAQSHEKIMDCCASPGGKSIFADIKSGDTLEITACDKSIDKVKTIKENIKRLRLKGIETRVQDATVYNEDDFEMYDKLIIVLKHGKISIFFL